MTGDASTMAYAIWKIFMKQYARLRYDPQPLSPKLIWHSYAAIQTTTVGHPLAPAPLFGVTTCTLWLFGPFPCPLLI